MPSSAPAPDQTPSHGALRSPTGRGRPYRPEVVAAVRVLIEETALVYGEIAARTGVPHWTILRWVRRFGWMRPAGRDVAEASRADGGEGVGRSGLGWKGRYGPEDVEAARAAIEGSSANLGRLERELGISTATLARWQRRFRWRRPAPPQSREPRFYRSVRRRGRPYAADAVGIARRLATTSLLPQKAIAAQAGVSQATVSKWIRRRGWVRPPARPGSPAFYASRRTAPTRTSGDRRGNPYDGGTVAAARELYRQTMLPAEFIAARVRVSVPTLYRWKKAGGWTRPRDLPDPQGRFPVRRRRRRRPVSSPAGGGGPCEAWWRGQRDGRDL